MENTNNIFLAIKTAIVALCGGFTAAFGWLGWLIVAWVACMVIDWVSGSDDSAKLQRIMVGPLSSGDVATLRKLCESLSLTSMGLYKEADGVLAIGPVSSGDAWSIMRQCEALELTDMGLYHSEYVD